MSTENCIRGKNMKQSGEDVVSILDDDVQRMPLRDIVQKTKRTYRCRTVLGLCVLCLLLIYVYVIKNEAQGRQPLLNSLNSYIRSTRATYSRLITEKPKVHKREHGLEILVLSGPNNTEKRSAIRQTWGLKMPLNVKINFVVGTKNLRDELKALITKEQNIQNDLLLLPNLTDSYKQLTAKVLEAMRWAHENTMFDYLLKVDDDTFVYVKEVLRRLQTKPRDRLYWGFFNNRSVIVTEGQWAEHKPYICEKYVSYALGGGYVLSRDLVAYLANNSDKLKKFTNEDVSVGTWLAPLEVHMVHDKSFRMSGDCKENQIVLHYASIDDMNKFHKSLAVNNSLCGIRKQNKTS